MALRRTLELTDEQRAELERYRDHDGRPYVRERCAALLKVAAHRSPHWVARHGLLKPRDPDTVYGWLTGYQRTGVAGLIAHRHGGARRRPLRAASHRARAPAGGAGEAARREVAVARSGPAPSRWTLRTIRATVDWLQPYSLSGVWRVLTGLDLRLRSAQVQQYSPDPAYAAKEAQLHACLREAAAAPEEVVAVFLDEMGYYRWPAPAPDWGPAAPAPPGQRRTVGTNSQWRIVGALNALTGQVNYLDDYIVGRKQLARFYAQLAQTYAR